MGMFYGRNAPTARIWKQIAQEFQENLTFFSGHSSQQLGQFVVQFLGLFTAVGDVLLTCEHCKEMWVLNNWKRCSRTNLTKGQELFLHKATIEALTRLSHLKVCLKDSKERMRKIENKLEYCRCTPSAAISIRVLGPKILRGVLFSCGDRGWISETRTNATSTVHVAVVATELSIFKFILFIFLSDVFVTSPTDWFLKNSIAEDNAERANYRKYNLPQDLQYQFLITLKSMLYFIFQTMASVAMTNW